MATDTWPRKCVNCQKDVEFNGNDPDFNGFGPCGKKHGKHQVESKLYFSPGARDIADVRDRKFFAPTIVLVPSYEKEHNGKRVQTRGLTVQFPNGKFETADPEAQYFLELKQDIAWGEGGLKMWQDIYLTPEGKANAARSEVDDLKRQLKESNSLLDQIKAEKAGKRATA
jgi:hypothetical protein